MNRIKILSEDVYSKIAAGEVIERPASVVRELVDNSIDANAKEIVVIVKNFGIENITVIDNGDGIQKEDMTLALTCHATSKIENINDLYKIWTMGFRGEALYSIQNVSRITIFSNTDPQGVTPGYKISNFGNKKFIIETIPFNKGTKVEVSDLFYNIPARRKFLKSKITELNQIKKVLSDKVFANLNIKFRLINDDKTIFSTDGDNNFQNTFFKIYNEEKFNIFEYEEKIDDFISIKIYYSNIDTYFSTRKYTSLFVNKRNVSLNFFYTAIDSGIKSYISQGRYPLIYYFITIDPSLIDVNIHPAKKEIKFFKDQEIFNIIKDSISKAFSKIIKDKVISQDFFIPQKNGVEIQKDIFDNISHLEKRIESNEFIQEERKNNCQYKYRIIGVAYDTYIIIEKDENIIFIDQHAAMEAILYHRKKEEYKLKATKEKLLIPILINLEKWDEKIEERIKKLNINGFLIEHNEGTTITIRDVPSILLNKKDYNIIIEIVEEFILSDYEKENIIDYLLILASCKESVKKGDRLNLNEVFDLVESYFKYNITNCPHGRPVQFELSKDYLEKIFQRRM